MALRHKKLAVLAPGTIWETKEWRSEGFAEVARHFLQRGFAVILIGAARERAACEEVARLAPGTVNLAGETTLAELAALIRRSTISITNDSGPMHLAVAVDRPVVSIFGPTDPIWIGPYGRPGAVLQAKLSLLAMLSAAAQPLPQRSRLHAAMSPRRTSSTRAEAVLRKQPENVSLATAQAGGRKSV